MQAAQVLKSHREAAEAHERKKNEESRQHHHETGEDGEEHSDSEFGEDEILIEVPKYLQGVPLVDPHAERIGEVCVSIGTFYTKAAHTTNSKCYLYSECNFLMT